MAISSPIFFTFLVIYSWAILGDCQRIAGGDSLPCIRRLLPCQQYLKGSSSQPPPSCCVPLKEIVVADSQCLCAVFNNAAMLKNLNVTQDDTLALAKSCGANADISVCRNAGTPSGSPSTPAAPSTTTNSSANSPPTKSGASVVSHVARWVVGMTAIFSFIVSAF